MWYTVRVFWPEKVTIAANLISAIGFLYLRFAESATLLYIGRIFGGYALGILFANTPLYNGEISQSKLRKFTGSFLLVFQNVGLVMTFGLSTIMSWRTTVLIMMGFPCLNTILLIFCPKSPTWLMICGQNEQAISVVRSLRGNEEVSVKEIQRIEQNIREAKRVSYSGY